MGDWKDLWKAGARGSGQVGRGAGCEDWCPPGCWLASVVPTAGRRMGEYWRPAGTSPGMTGLAEAGRGQEGWHRKVSSRCAMDTWETLVVGWEAHPTGQCVGLSAAVRWQARWQLGRSEAFCP